MKLWQSSLFFIADYRVNWIKILKVFILISALILPVKNTFSQTLPEQVLLSEEELRWIADNPVLTATNNMDLVPLDFVQDGRSTGFAVDYLNLVASKVGLKIEYQNGQSWDELVNNIKLQKIDITHSLMATPERREFLNFTTPYLEIPVVNFGRKGSDRINRLEDLKGRKIGVIQGWAITDVYREKYPEFELVEYTAIKDALVGLSTGEVDVVTGSQFTLDYFIAQNFLTNLVVIGDDFAFNTGNRVKHHIASRNDLPILRDILQKGMDAVSDIEYRYILQRWGIEYSTKDKVDLTNEEIRWITENPMIRVTNKMEMTPLDFVEGDGPAGFSIEYMDLIARKTGLKFEYVNGQTWDQLLENLKNRNIDVSHSLVLSPERQEYLDFTDPYLNLPWVYFGRTGADHIENIEDLRGKKIGIVEGTLPWDLYTKEYPNLNVIPYKSSIQALNDVSQGIIDIHPQIYSVATYKIKRNLIEGVEVIGDRFFPQERANNQFRIAVRNDWPILMNIIEKGMAAVSQDEFSEISEKWYTQVQQTINIGLTEEERIWLAKNNDVRISVNANSGSPFETVDEEGNFIGISGDMLALVENLLGINFEIIRKPNWEESFEEVTSARAELLPVVVKTEEREKELIFTDAYYSESIAIFSYDEAINFATLESLFGYTIAQIRNDATTNHIKMNYPDITIIEVDSLSEAIKLVLDKKADAHIGVLSRTHHYLAEEGIKKIGVVGDTPMQAELSMAVNTELPLLANAINKALTSIPEYEKQRIIQKWLAVQIVSKIDYILAFRTLLIAGVILAIIIYWNNKLRNEVKRRIETEQKLKIEQEKTLEALDHNHQQMIELQFQRETIEKSAEAQAVLMDELSLMSANLQKKYDLLTEIMDNTGHGIVVFSKDLKLQAWNDTFKNIMGLQDREYEEGMDYKLFFELNKVDETKHLLSVDAYIYELKERIKNRKSCNEFSWDMKNPDGVIINTTERIMDDGTLISIYEDVTLIRQEELRIQEMALCDGLTGLANRRAFDVNIEQAIHRFTLSNTPFLLAYMDLDNFKNLNDTQGHNAGDAVLVHVAGIIKKYIRDNDVPARLGGDEFAIIFQNTHDIEAAAKRLEKMITEIKNTKTLNGFDINIGASAGLAQCFDNDISANEMVEIADRALYQAKENGKGQVFKSLSA